MAHSKNGSAFCQHIIWHQKPNSGPIVCFSVSYLDTLQIRWIFVPNITQLFSNSIIPNLSTSQQFRLTGNSGSKHCATQVCVENCKQVQCLTYLL